MVLLSGCVTVLLPLPPPPPPPPPPSPPPPLLHTLPLYPQPFLSLSSEELSRTLPLLSEVPVETLKVALPLLAKQDISVVQRMIKFLKLVRERFFSLHMNSD